MKLLGLFAVVCIFTALVAETETAQRVFIDAMDQIIGKTSKTASSNVVNKAVASSTKKGAGISASMKQLVKNLQKKTEAFGKSAMNKVKNLAPLPSSLGGKNSGIKQLEKTILKMDKQLRSAKKQLQKINA
uniref:Hypothetical secreted protein n=1 Tax=Simulium nigrimanum TaxID=683695 RepID=D1FPV4_SIMNI